MENEAEIITMAIDPKFQRKGVGYSILIKLFNLLNKTNCEQLFLEVASNNKPGIKLYTKAGFKRCGIRKNYYKVSGDKKINALIMKKRLRK